MSKTIYHLLVAGLVLTLGPARGGEPTPKLLGANSCASSGCHGGGGATQNQVLVWSLKDFHSQRPPATLATARSKQIADALEIKAATTDARCTACHAPLNSVPENQRGEFFKVSEGVTCESCHGPAENWIRSHTRHDWTRADRTTAGMRDLQNLYVRANTCVACHQNVNTDILKAGHPELIFELDGQSVAEPKHWSAEKNGNGAQAWLVGQAVALREMSWDLAIRQVPNEKELNRWLGLVWVLQKLDGLNFDLPKLGKSPAPAEAKDFAATKEFADTLAQAAAAAVWTEGNSQRALQILSSSSEDFKNVSGEVGARRAERLVLALDRLLAAQNNHKADAELNQLFKLAQSIPDFDAKQFAVALDKFATALATP